MIEPPGRRDAEKKSESTEKSERRGGRAQRGLALPGYQLRADRFLFIMRRWGRYQRSISRDARDGADPPHASRTTLLMVAAVLGLLMAFTAVLDSAYRRTQLSRAEARYREGMELASAGRHAGAAEDFRVALLYEPDDPRFPNQRPAESHAGPHRRADGRNNEAIDDYHRAIFGYWPVRRNLRRRGRALAASSDGRGLRRDRFGAARPFSLGIPPHPRWHQVAGDTDLLRDRSAGWYVRPDAARGSDARRRTGGLARHYWAQPTSPVSSYVLVGMGTFFAGVFRAPMTPIFMVF